MRPRARGNDEGSHERSRPPVYVLATDVWTPTFPNLEAWLEGRESPRDVDLRPALANPRLLRGTSLATRMQVHVATTIVDRAGLDRTKVASVFGSAFGEIEIALLQIDMMVEGDGIVSPARFKNSVHNAGSGVFSIAAQNHGFTTAIAGGPHTVGDCLVESIGLLHDGHEHVITVVAEEPLPVPLSELIPYDGLGAGWALSSSPDHAIAKLDSLHFEATTNPALPALPAAFRRNPCAHALFLAEAIARRRWGRIALGGGYSVAVEPP